MTPPNTQQPTVFEKYEDHELQEHNRGLDSARCPTH